MDIIASHQQGLFELLQVEAEGLAGGPRDSAQRAVVYHHLADSLGLAHGYALLCARAALRIDPAVARIERAVRRSWWRLDQDKRAALRERVERFGEALRSIDAERCAAALLAYRLVATPGLAGEAERRLDPDLRAAFEACRKSRGVAGRAERQELFAAHQRWAEGLFGGRIEAAIAALDWPIGARAVRAAIALLRIPMSVYQRAEARGLARIEREIRSAKALPASFAVNPAQAFYALQRHLAERRRRSPVEGDDLPLDEAVRLAA